MNSSGDLLGGSGTDFCFKFSFYSDATVGSPDTKVWPSGDPSTMTASVKNGVFNAGIGDTVAGGDTLNFNFQDNDAVYLNVEVATRAGATCAPGDGAESFENLAPRQRILASGYSINAATVGGFTPSQSPTDSNIPVLTSGNLIFGGAATIDSTSTNALSIGTNANAKTITIGNSTGATGLVFTKGSSGAITFTGFTSCTALETDSSGVLVCGSDDGGSGSTLATQENDTTVVSTTTVLDFLGTDFAVTLEGLNEANVAIDYASSTVTRASQPETVTGAWVFNTTTTLTAITIGGDTINEFVGTGLVLSGNSLTAALGTAIDTSEITDGTITGDDINSNIAGGGLVLTAGSPDVLDIGAGFGITVNASDIALATSTNITWGGTHTFNATTTHATTSIVTLIIGGDTITELVGTGLALSGSTLTTTLGTAVDTSEITDGTITGDDINSNIAGGGLVLTAGSPDVLDIGAGFGITVNASDIAIATSTTFVWGAAHTFNATTSLTTIVIAGDTITDLTGTGLATSGTALVATLGTAIDTSEITDGTITGDDVNANIGGAGLTLTAASPDTLDIDLLDANDSTGATFSQSGIEFQGAGNDELTLLQGCAANDVLKWSEANSRWECQADVSGGTPTLDSVSAAIADGAERNSSVNTVNWNWNFSSAAVDTGLDISENVASTLGTQDQQALLELSTLAGSTASPLQITSNSADVGDIFINLASLGDFEVRDAGTAFVTFTDAGAVTLAGHLTLSGDANEGLSGGGLTDCDLATQTLNWDSTTNKFSCGTDEGVDGVTVTTFVADGTWTKADYVGLKFTQVITTAGGGGGGGGDGDGTAQEGAGGGGGAGGTAIEMFAAATLGDTESVAVATSGGAGGSGTNGTAGTDGGAASFGTVAYHSATGGIAGAGTGVSAGVCATADIGNGGAGSTATGGDINLTGGGGIASPYCVAEDVQGGVGGASYWGGGGIGGSSVAANACSAGGVGPYGAGGGGATSEDCSAGAAGGDGTDGIVVTMNYKASGGDLAEWYETKDGVEAGDVVAISRDFLEYDSKLGLDKTSILEKAVSGTSIVGVVSTVPFQTMGGDIFSTAKHPRPVALAGRVPVKVSEENGKIKSGDLLTSSSIPGFAMRSTKAGVIIGRALEDVDCVEGEVCKVLVMVNTSYSTGALLKVAYRDEGLFLDSIDGDINSGRDIGRAILAHLLQEKQNIMTSPTLSEIFTDRVVAGLEVITPKVITQGLIAESISALDKEIVFNSDTIFFGRPYFNSDAGGLAIVAQGQQAVAVTFEREYLEPPVVNVTPGGEPATLEGLHYAVAEKDVKGFTILLNRAAPADITFNWTALAVKNPKVFGAPSTPVSEGEAVAVVQEASPVTEVAVESEPAADEPTSENDQPDGVPPAEDSPQVEETALPPPETEESAPPAEENAPPEEAESEAPAASEPEPEPPPPAE